MVMTVSAPISIPPVAMHTRCEEIRFSSIIKTRMQVRPLGNVVGDSEQPFDRHAVGGLVEERRRGSPCG